jgi:hypothetical protein
LVRRQKVIGEEQSLTGRSRDFWKTKDCSCSHDVPDFRGCGRGRTCLTVIKDFGNEGRDRTQEHGSR